MPKIKLTHRGIETLKAGKWLTDFMDDTLTGFGVRVHHTGRKTFFVRYDLGTCPFRRNWALDPVKMGSGVGAQRRGLMLS